jgi:hypothetical protein
MKTEFTHTYAEWNRIAMKLRTGWPQINWPSGAIQRTAETIGAEVTNILQNDVIERKGFTYRVDGDDWDAMAAMLVVGA